MTGGRRAAGPVALSLLPEQPVTATNPPPAAYAEVAVDVGGAGPDRLFTYGVPAALAGQVAPGQRVQVPFSRRSAPATGVVFSVSADPPQGSGAVLPLAAVIDAEPCLTPADLDLAAWLAQETICSLAQALRALLPPPGAREQTRLHYYPAPGSEAQAAQAALARAPAQRAAWAAVAATPGLTAIQLQHRGCTPAALRALVARGQVLARPQGSPRDPFAEEPAITGEAPPALTGPQAAAVAALGPAIGGPLPRTFLLFGVTGSGKTEVYLRAIAEVLAAGRQAAVLVPEIALTPQTVATFRRRFGDRVAVLHSGLSAGQRHDQWWRARRGEVDVVVGARSAVFAPLPRLGLIVVDEEHEPSYKQDEAPRYHARSVAAERAGRLGIPLLLGSATPDLQTWEAARAGTVLRLDLPQRIADRPLPEVRLVDLRDQGGPGLFSPPLTAALTRCLEVGRQALLFLNRRGFAPALLCSACSYVARCQSCSLSLCYHDADRALHCHCCGARRPVPRLCPNCGGHFLRLRGSGTEKVASEVARLFPAARVLRMDLDTTGTKGAHRRIYEAFREGHADVLVGTQMVAKGWDVAGVTLVGVIDADTALYHPDYRCAERTFQLLCQVAGRAGRGEHPGEVLVQTHSPEHFAVAAAARHDYLRFAEGELAARRTAGFPPFGRLLRLLAWSPRAAEAQAAATSLAEAIRPELPPGVDLWGPSEAPLAMLRGQHRWHLLLRGQDGAVLRNLARAALEQLGRRGAGARVAADPDPQSML